MPDFRSPKTGIYSNMHELGIDEPEDVFDVEFFRINPKPFYKVLKDLHPAKYAPTLSHYFLTLLEQKGLLSMVFTQNIDCLELRAGLSSDKLVQAHGTFATQRCVDCHTPYPDHDMNAAVKGRCVPRCFATGCNSPVKPDIVFFGEPLPPHFYNNRELVGCADLVLIIGTSLSVQPFSSLPNIAPSGTPRVLFNLERVGQLGTRPDDVLVLGPIDAGIRKLAEELDWLQELDDMWRTSIGTDEAEKQLQRVPRITAEMDQLTDQLETALSLEDKESEMGRDSNEDETRVKLSEEKLQNNNVPRDTNSPTDL